MLDAFRSWLTTRETWSLKYRERAETEILLRLCETNPDFGTILISPPAETRSGMLELQIYLLAAS